MTELAKLIRTERGLAVNETQINKEVIRILEFESDLANVRHLGSTITLPEIPTDLFSLLNHCTLSSGNTRFTMFDTSPVLYFSFLGYRYSGGP